MSTIEEDSYIKKMIGNNNQEEVTETYTNITKPWRIILKMTSPESTVSPTKTPTSAPENPKDIVLKLTKTISSRLLNLADQVELLKSASPEQLNSDLEILQDENILAEVRLYINKNLETFRKSINSTIRKWMEKSNHHPIEDQINGDIESCVSVVINYLYGKYTKRCHNSKTANIEILKMNNCIRLLLQIEVLGVHSTKTTKID